MSYIDKNRESIILDKSFFQCTSLKSINELSKRHIVILPHVLFEECIRTQKNPGPDQLIKKALNAIKEGSYTSLSLANILKTEIETKQTINSIIDNDLTEGIRNDELQFFATGSKYKIEKDLNPLVLFIEKIKHEFCNTLSNKEYAREWRQTDEIVGNRYIKFSNAASDQIIRSYFDKLYPTIISHVKNDWFSWHLMRMLIVLGIDWAYKRNKSGPSYQGSKITNDVYDMQYAIYLARADLLKSNDKGLLAFAQALFPNKIL